MSLGGKGEPTLRVGIRGRGECRRGVQQRLVALARRCCSFRYVAVVDLAGMKSVVVVAVGWFARVVVVLVGI